MNGLANKRNEKYWTSIYCLAGELLVKNVLKKRVKESEQSDWQAD